MNAHLINEETIYRPSWLGKFASSPTSASIIVFAHESCRQNFCYSAKLFECIGIRRGMQFPYKAKSTLKIRWSSACMNQRKTLKFYTEIENYKSGYYAASCVKAMFSFLNPPQAYFVLTWFFLQIIDDNNQEVPPGKTGRVALRVKPYRPLGLFTCYVVSENLLIWHRWSFI